MEPLERGYRDWEYDWGGDEDEVEMYAMMQWGVGTDMEDSDVEDFFEVDNYYDD